MSSQSIFEKLQLKDQKNLLIQGLPSSLEKQFVKLSFAKNVTPLLKTRKIDFALIFAISQRQLKEILNDVIPALSDTTTFWIAYPKLTSKIASDLSRDANWDCLEKNGFQTVRSIALDNVWTALRFKRPEKEEIKKDSFSSANPAPGVDYTKRTIETPPELQAMLNKNKAALSTFTALSFSHKREYVEWILNAKKEETRKKRLHTTIEKLTDGKKSYGQK